MEIFCRYFIYLMIYSFLGWSLEVVCKLFELKKFVNRGFLIGPICPIYGYGVLFIILLIGNYTSDILGVFLKSILICSVLEYLTSYIMEKLFKARWWDYSKRKFNINGRICLETMIPFGILGCTVIYFLHPLVEKLVGSIPINVMIVLAFILMGIYIVDNIISFNVMNKIKQEIKRQRADNTEDIRKRVTLWLSNNSILYRHIRNAYPKFKILNKIKNKREIS